MDAVQQQNLKQFDTTARTWLSTAGFSREHRNALTTAIGRVVRSEQGFNGLAAASLRRSRFAKLEQAYGKDLDAKLQLAAKMIDTLEQPGIKALLKPNGIGDSSLVVSALIQQAARWELRNRR